jgi:hypothetical protein
VAHDLEIAVDAGAALPEGGRALLNPDGLCPVAWSIDWN